MSNAKVRHRRRRRRQLVIRQRVRRFAAMSRQWLADIRHTWSRPDETDDEYRERVWAWWRDGGSKRMATA